MSPSRGCGYDLGLWMFTVILLSEYSERLLARWREVFVPFEEQDQIAFCAWHQGQLPGSLEQAVPDLGAAIKGKEEWRVLVVGTGHEHGTPSEYLSRDNPFDFAGALALDNPEQPGVAPMERSPFSLVRLTHMLLGYPELGPMGFEPDPSFRDAKTEQVRYESEFMAGVTDDVSRTEAERAFREALAEGHHPQIHYRVQEASPEEREKHAALTKLYEARQARPTEVLSIATRLPRTELLRNQLNAAWFAHERQQSSQFVERNRYPASCRFLVHDMKPQGHASVDLEELRFFMGILTLAVNDLPASGLQSDRLYRLDVEVDDAELGHTLNRHLGDLVDVRQYVNQRLQTVELQPRPTESAVLEDVSIKVNFEKLRGETLRVPESGYSLATDRPSNEMERWRNGVDALGREIARFLREPSRALAQAVSETRAKQGRSIVDDSPLSSIDVEELQEDLARRSNGLVRHAADYGAEPERLRELISRNDKQIRKAINERLTARSIGIVLGVALGVWVAALLPYVVKAYFEGPLNLGESLLVALVLVGAVVLVAYCVLEVMRRQLVGLIKRTNSELRAYVSAVTRAAQDYASFLSELVTYTLGKRRLLEEQSRMTRHKSEQQRLKRLRDRIEDKIELEKSLVKSAGCAIHIQQGDYAVSELEKFGLSRAERILLWPRSRGSCEFNRSGDSVVAPYSFIKRLSVKALVIQNPMDGSAFDPNYSRSTFEPHVPDDGASRGAL